VRKSRLQAAFGTVTISQGPNGRSRSASLLGDTLCCGGIPPTVSRRGPPPSFQTPLQRLVNTPCGLPDVLADSRPVGADASSFRVTLRAVNRDSGNLQVQSVHLADHKHAVDLGKFPPQRCPQRLP